MTSDKGVVERLREYLASRPDPSGRTFHAMHPEVLAQEAIDRIKALERALTDLVNKLDAIDKPVANVFVFAGAHGYHYAGPNYADELSAARAALSPSATGSDNAG